VGDVPRQPGAGSPHIQPRRVLCAAVTERVDYSLARGRHKARVVADRLGLRAENAELLRHALLNAVRTHDAVSTENDCFGQRFVVEFMMDGPRGGERVRSAWIVKTDKDFPRLRALQTITFTFCVLGGATENRWCSSTADA